MVDILKAALLVWIITGSFLVGWYSAHHEISTECIRQGGFYVGDNDYWCFEKPKNLQRKSS